MTLGFATSIRDAEGQAIIDGLGTSPLMRFYAGTKPATGGTAGTLIAECVCSATPATVTSGVITFAAIANDASIDASGTVEWFRLVKADGTFCIDGTVTNTGGGGDVTTPSTAWVATEPLAVSSLVFTIGNA